MSDLLEDTELEDALKKCPEWETERGFITRTVEFEEFVDSIDFVNDLAEIAQKAQHFPEIRIKENRVTLRLTSPDIGGVSTQDIQLAKRIDTLID